MKFSTKLKSPKGMKKKSKFRLRRCSSGLSFCDGPIPELWQLLPSQHDASIFGNSSASIASVASINPDLSSPTGFCHSSMDVQRPSVFSVNSSTSTKHLICDIIDKALPQNPPISSLGVALAANRSIDLNSKPLPLAIDIDAKKDVSHNIVQYDQSRILCPAYPPKTTDSTMSWSRHEKRASKGQHSVMPSITSSLDSRRGSKSSLDSRGFSSASSSTPSQVHSLCSDSDSPISAKRGKRPSHIAIVQDSVLSEVEGTLAATISKLQQLQPTSRQESSTVTLNHGSSDKLCSQEHPRTVDVSHNSILSGNRNLSSSSTTHDRSFQSTSSKPLESPTCTIENGTRDSSGQDAYSHPVKQVNTLDEDKNFIKTHCTHVRAAMARIQAEKTSLAFVAKEAQSKLDSVLEQLEDAKLNETAIQTALLAAQDQISSLTASYDKERRRSASLMEDLEVEKQCRSEIAFKLEEANSQKIDLMERDVEYQQERITCLAKLQTTTQELLAAKELSSQSVHQASYIQDLRRKLAEAVRQNESSRVQVKKLLPLSELPAVMAEQKTKIECLQRHLHERSKSAHSLQTQVNTTGRITAELATLKAKLRKKDQVISNLRSLHSEVVKSSAAINTQNRELDKEILNLRDCIETSSVFSSPISDDAQQETLELHDLVRRTRIERDRFSTLLHAELRRSAIQDHDRVHPSLDLLQQKPHLQHAIDLIRQRAHTYLKHDSTGDHLQVNYEGATVQDLASEIEYYLNDIMLYKLDVRGYRKDLRRAQEKIRELGGPEDF